MDEAPRVLLEAPELWSPLVDWTAYLAKLRAFAAMGVELLSGSIDEEIDCAEKTIEQLKKKAPEKGA